MKPRGVKWWVRALYQRISTRLSPRYARRHVVLFRYTKALGDNLFLTTVAHEVKRRNPNCHLHVVTGLPELFDRSPDVDIVQDETNHRIPNIGRHLIRYEHRFPWKRHILYECVSCVDIHDEIGLRTYIYPSKVDEAWADRVQQRFQRPVVLLCRSAGPRNDKKNWPFSKWESLKGEIDKHAAVVEIGVKPASPTTGPHADVETDLRGRTTIHELAALMKRADLLVCPVTGVLHLAASAGLRSIVLVGGSEGAIGTQYPGNVPISERPDCADCYEKGPCSHEFKCMKRISVERVLREVIGLLRLNR